MLDADKLREEIARMEAWRAENEAQIQTAQAKLVKLLFEAEVNGTEDSAQVLELSNMIDLALEHLRDEQLLDRKKEELRRIEQASGNS